jgi:hypothetical protein
MCRKIGTAPLALGLAPASTSGQPDSEPIESPRVPAREGRAAENGRLSEGAAANPPHRPPPRDRILRLPLPGKGPPSGKYPPVKAASIPNDDVLLTGGRKEDARNNPKTLS